MENEELKPCPFCGASGALVKLTCSDDPVDSDSWSTKVECTSCGASICGHKHSAIKKWNTRSSDQRVGTLYRFLNYIRNHGKVVVRTYQDKLGFLTSSLAIAIGNHVFRKTMHYHPNSWTQLRGTDDKLLHPLELGAEEAWDSWLHEEMDKRIEEKRNAYNMYRHHIEQSDELIKSFRDYPSGIFSINDNDGNLKLNGWSEPTIKTLKERKTTNVKKDSI